MNQTIIQYIIEQLHGGNTELEINPEDDLLGSGLIESLGMMRLIQFIEEKYEVKVGPQDMTVENFMTVEAMVNFIEQAKQ